MTSHAPDDDAIGDLPGRLTFYIKAAEAVQHRRTEPHLKALGISYVQLALLMAIGRLHSPSAAELSRRLGSTPQSTGEVIAALLRKKLIYRTEDETTRRVLRLNLMPAGAELLDRVDSILTQLEKEWIDGMDPAAISQVKAVLAKLIARDDDDFVPDGLVG